MNNSKILNEHQSMFPGEGLPPHPKEGQFYGSFGYDLSLVFH